MLTRMRTPTMMRTRLRSWRTMRMMMLLLPWAVTKGLLLRAHLQGPHSRTGGQTQLWAPLTTSR